MFKLAVILSVVCVAAAQLPPGPGPALFPAGPAPGPAPRGPPGPHGPHEPVPVGPHIIPGPVGPLGTGHRQVQDSSFEIHTDSRYTQVSNLREVIPQVNIPNHHV
ncbi:cuticle collagen 2-like [Schistocerca gregaria]|uniref:cuticle collagen 2-like n=1 Tax=Schistocerca gregaria TaxID=7010 RepID=UPI00211EA00E|nr:cuticle collagen 2-like [Schistocerca gregaria]